MVPANRQIATWFQSIGRQQYGCNQQADINMVPINRQIATWFMPIGRQQHGSNQKADSNMVFISRNAVPINIATWFLSILENAEIKNIVFVTLIFCILYCIKMFIVRLDMSTLFCKYSTSDQTGSAILKYSFQIRIRINVRRYGLMLVYYNTEYL